MHGPCGKEEDEQVVRYHEDRGVFDEGRDTHCAHVEGIGQSLSVTEP